MNGDSKISPLLTKLNNYGQQGNKTPIRGVDVAEKLRDYVELKDLLPSHNSPAICEPSNSERSPLTHQRLKKFVAEEFDLLQYGIPHGQRVGLLLPNGPELAVAVIATISHWCAAPINPTNTWQEIKSELQSTKSIAIMVLAGASVNEAALKAAEELKIGIITITPLGSISGIFHTSLLRSVSNDFTLVKTVPENTAAGYRTYNHPEIVLLLHTSGTSGNKKLVPYSMDMIITGVGCIVASWNLQPTDVCLNMMPLFHIGGIMRNILSPILSGGAVICCSGFDPLLFWDVLYSSRDNTDVEPDKCIPPVTWYYAAPTMHHAILMESERRPHPLPVQTVRYIANAAGGLLPVLANRLKDTFDAVILTSYGMTECMPISTPPQSYRLDPTGTSGTPVGPDILIVGEDMHALPTGSKGNICVRGPPCFGGYENNGTANEESFLSVPGHGDGWFNTGDMGHLDAQGFLFISGRSKEIINRGGETISPFEIEEVIQQHPNIKETIAFSAPHEQYQETVGIILVSKPNKPRLDLPALHKYIENKLHRSKWPYIIVYSDGLPKNAAGKTLRIKYADRIALKNVDEESSPLSRLLEASCPPVGTALTVPIAAKPVSINYAETKNFFLQYANSYGIQNIHTVLVDLPSQQDALVAFVVIDPLRVASTKSTDALLQELLQIAQDKLHAYLIPQFMFEIGSLPLEKNSKKIVDENALKLLAIEKYNATNIIAPRNAIETQIELIWRSQLGCASTLSVTSSFFELGGDSLKAGQIVGIMRDTLRVPLSVADLFTAPTIEKIAVKISKSKVMGSPQINKPKALDASPYNHTGGASTSSNMIRNEARKKIAASFQKNLLTIEEEKQEKLHQEYMTWEFTPPLSNTSFGCLFIQALPIVLIYPLRRISIWFLIAAPWVTMMDFGFGRFISLLCAMFLSRLLLGIFAPLCGIAAKWLIIGRYQPGKYPLWGAMYLKWWIVEQIINIMGKGFFRDDLPIIGPYLVRWYYILMGASIGKNVKIHKDAKIGQADLLTIEDDVAIDNCIIRPFSIEEGHFVLLPIKLGKGSSVGVKSVVSAGSTIPPGACLGPLSSSHELNDADPKNRQYCRPTYQQPPNSYIIFFGIPILLLVLAVSMIPWYIVLHDMVSNAKEEGWYATRLYNIYQVFLWWITPERFKYFLFLRVVKRCVVPFIRLAMIILIKWTVIGKFTVMSEEEKLQPWNRFRYWLMAKLLPGGGLAGVAKLVGTHYECISIIYRMLGAKIGKHVYWPGSGLEIVEYDLFEIGDDVVFGSRSVIITSSSKASKKVTFESGSMVADRCVILPGVTLKRGAVLGSGALAAEDMLVPVGSVWLGSQDGCALNVAPADQSYAVKDTISPFARGFYKREANFFVIPLSGVILYNTLWQAFCTCYRNCPTVLSLMICSYIKQFDPFDSHSPLELLKMTYVAFAPLYLIMCSLALLVDISGKWLILGRRKAGEYPWDQSSYCQRWQLYLTLQEIRRGERHKTGILDMIQGSQYLVWYFRMLGAKIGNNVCLYPNGGDPMFTEPDLVTIGDFVGIDDASLIAHINTRGVFRLNPLTVGTGCILKSMSRLLSGGSMEPHSILYEHTLVLSGENVGAGSVWQGWPSRAQFTIKEHRDNLKYLLNEVSLRNRWEMRSYASAPNEDQPLIGSNKGEKNVEEGHSQVPLTPGMYRSPAVGLVVRPQLTSNTMKSSGNSSAALSSHFAGDLATTTLKNSERQPLLPNGKN